MHAKFKKLKIKISELARIVKTVGDLELLRVKGLGVKITHI